MRTFKLQSISCATKSLFHSPFVFWFYSYCMNTVSFCTPESSFLCPLKDGFPVPWRSPSQTVLLVFDLYYFNLLLCFWLGRIIEKCLISRDDQQLQHSVLNILGQALVCVLFKLNGCLEGNMFCEMFFSGLFGL